MKKKKDPGPLYAVHKASASAGKCKMVHRKRAKRFKPCACTASHVCTVHASEVSTAPYSAIADKLGVV